MTAATDARAAVQRELEDESAARWTANEVDRALARALGEYSEAWPAITSVDIAKGSTDVLDVTATANFSSSRYIYAVWVEYPINDGPPAAAIRYREERRGIVRLIDATPPVQGENCRVWYARARAADFTDVEAVHLDLVYLGAVAYALMAKAAGSIGAVNVSGWTPRQYRELGEVRLGEFRRRVRVLGDGFTSGAPAAVWSSAEV